jgi:hypothetical protein
LEQVAADGKKRKMNLYNLDIIISVGYRVNSSQATKFRQWATVRLKDYLVKGYAINEYRLHQKQQEVEFLKTGLRIVSRGIEDAASDKEQEVFRQFAKGLALLDDYDHEALDQKGLTHKKPFIPHTMNIWNSLGRCIPNSSLRYLQNPKTKVFIVPSTKSNKALEKPNYNQA